MLNLIKLMVAIALASFSVNASAYVMTGSGSWGDMGEHEQHQGSGSWGDMGKQGQNGGGSWADMGELDYLPEDPQQGGMPDKKHDVPEPGMVGLLAIGLLGVAIARRRFKE